MRFKGVILMSLLVLFGFNIVFSQKVLEKDLYQTISISPLSLFGFNYDLVLKKKHSIQAGGSLSYWMKNLSYQGGLLYKYYFKEVKMKRKKNKKYMGKKLLHFGPLLKFIHLENTYQDVDKVKYDYDADYFCIGLHFGKKRIFKPGITIGTRVGYGYPIEINEFKWKNIVPSENEGIIKDITRYTSGFDMDITIGFSF